MIKFLVILAGLFALGIVAIGSFLSPDSLSSCEVRPSAAENCQKADAIVAVSGGNTDVRVDEAIELYKTGWADTLIFSGAASDDDSPSNAEVMREHALAAGVPQAAIIIEPAARTTHENARNTNKIFQTNNIKSIIVVTSPYHQRRAGIEFQAMTEMNVQVRNHPASNDPDWPWYWWATPRGWWLAVGELAKSTATYAGGSR